MPMSDSKRNWAGFPRPLNNRLSDVMEWMENQEVVEDDAQVMLGLSLLFLVVCLLNTIGLLLAKFLGKSTVISPCAGRSGHQVPACLFST